MKPISFPEQTCIIAENQKEYIPLPAHCDAKQGTVSCCWKLSFKERIKLLFTGRLWHQIYTFNKPLQPIYLSVNKYDIFTLRDALHNVDWPKK